MVYKIGNVKDVEGLVKTVLALEDDLYIHLNNLQAFAQQAGKNIYEMVRSLDSGWQRNRNSDYRFRNFLNPLR